MFCVAIPGLPVDKGLGSNPDRVGVSMQRPPHADDFSEKFYAERIVAATTHGYDGNPLVT
jgi:hypothetical protein